MPSGNRQGAECHKAGIYDGTFPGVLPVIQDSGAGGAVSGSERPDRGRVCGWFFGFDEDCIWDCEEGEWLRQNSCSFPVCGL